LKRLVYFMALCCILAALPGCAASTVSAVEVKSGKAREAAPQVSPQDAATFVAGNTDFALGLYQTVRSTEGNMFFSPHSISEALAMAFAGAQGGTQTEMAGTLHFTLPQDRLHPAINYLDSQLASRGQGAKGKDGKGFRLNIVNAIWGQQGFKFTDQYLDTLATNYGAGLRLADFVKKPEESRSMINNWVSTQTEDRIKDLIPKGSINEMTRLVLTNAVYFNAAWQSPFRKESTSPGPFHRLDGSDATVPLMRQSASYRYTKGDGFQAVELPYDGRELSMLVMLPESGKFKQFEGSLDSVMLQRVVSGLKSMQVDLTMPKFQFEQSMGLKKTLTDMGMRTAFTDAADFSGMDGKKDLRIQDVLHKAFVSVDEEGTEAAAATAVIVGTTSMPVEVAEMRMDRPFIFLIRDNATGAVIFMGRVVDPSAK
jgi:serpin B